MNQPLVSVIVPTRNSEPVIRACLQSIKDQTYPNIELILVDRDSTDATKQIAAEFTTHIYNHGPERSAQRNLGAQKAAGQYVAIIDSDMQLDPQVINDCVAQFTADPTLAGVVIPEESFGEGFWAQCKRLERSFYVGVTWIEAARCFPAQIYHQLGGYDETMVSGEDWDLARRAEKLGPIGHTQAFIRHNEGRINLWKTLKKKYYYAQQAKAYLSKHQTGSNLTAQVGPLQRYKLFFSKPAHLFHNPILGLGMLFMKTCEYGAGAVGYYGASRDVK